MRVTLISMVYPWPRVGFWPGIERQIGHFAEGLRDAGADVTVITSFRNGDKESEEHEGIRIHRVSDSGHRFGKAGYVLDAHVRTLGAHALRLTDVVNASDVIESFVPLPVSGLPQGNRPALFAFFAHRDRPARWTDYLHQPFHYRLEKDYFQRVDSIIVASSESRHVLTREYDVPESKIEVIPLGVAPCFLLPEHHDNRRPRPAGDVRKEPHLLYVGPLIPRKNLGILIDALPELHHAGIAARLTLAGSGSERAALEERASRLGVGGMVEFPGFVEDSELPGLYQAADAFVFPSLKEGFGQVLIEAMACGLPVVTSSRPPMPEVVGEAGVLFDPEDPRDLASRLIETLSSGSELARMRAAGLRRVHEKYKWKRIAETTLEAYQKVRAA